MQAKRLVPMIEEVLESSATSYSELSAIACTVGPGSFTGIRIGLAAARAIGFAANIPVLGFSGLEVLALAAIENTGRGNDILVIMNAGKGEVIYQLFNDELQEMCTPTLGKIEDAMKKADSSTVIAGNVVENKITFPRADMLAKMAANFPQKSRPPLPFYVRPPDAKLPQMNKSG